jgi:hypothetical protein
VAPPQQALLPSLELSNRPATALGGLARHLPEVDDPASLAIQRLDRVTQGDNKTRRDKPGLVVDLTARIPLRDDSRRDTPSHAETAPGCF